MYALINGQEKAAEKLVDEGASPWAHLGHPGGESEPPSALHLAAQLHSAKVITALLQTIPESRKLVSRLDS